MARKVNKEKAFAISGVPLVERLTSPDAAIAASAGGAGAQRTPAATADGAAPPSPNALRASALFVGGWTAAGRDSAEKRGVQP